MIDLLPAARRTAAVINGITDDQLDRPTPCPDLSVGDLLDHIRLFAAHFAEAARKNTRPRTEAPAPPTRDNLADGWSEQVSAGLFDLADAWSDDAAWEGSTIAGGFDLPASVAALIAIDELIVHGWDLAVSTGQTFAATDEEIEAALSFVNSFEAPRDGGLFGPVVDVRADASSFDRLLGLTGRDPSWRPD